MNEEKINQILKCIECDKPAEYILSGGSLCKIHFEQLKPIVEQMGKINLEILKDMEEEDLLNPKEELTLPEKTKDALQENKDEQKTN